jgi:hypothetical protein
MSYESEVVYRSASNAMNTKQGGKMAFVTGAINK